MTILTCSCCVENQISTTLQRSLGTIAFFHLCQMKACKFKHRARCWHHWPVKQDLWNTYVPPVLSLIHVVSCQVGKCTRQAFSALPAKNLHDFANPQTIAYLDKANIQHLCWCQMDPATQWPNSCVPLYPCNLVGIPQSRFGKLCILYLFKDSYSSLFRSVSMQVTSYPRFPCSDLATCKAGCSPRTKRTKLTLCCGMEVSLVQRDKFPRFWGSQILKFRERD